MKVTTKANYTSRNKKNVTAVIWSTFLVGWISSSWYYNGMYLDQILPAAGIITFLLLIRDYSYDS